MLLKFPSSQIPADRLARTGLATAEIHRLVPDFLATRRPFVERETLLIVAQKTTKFELLFGIRAVLRSWTSDDDEVERQLVEIEKYVDDRIFDLVDLTGLPEPRGPVRRRQK